MSISGVHLRYMYIYILGTSTSQVHVYLRYMSISGVHLRYMYISGMCTSQVRVHLRYVYISGICTSQVFVHLRYIYISGICTSQVHLHLRYIYISGTSTSQVCVLVRWQDLRRCERPVHLLVAAAGRRRKLNENAESYEKVHISCSVFKEYNIVIN